MKEKIINEIINGNYGKTSTEEYLKDYTTLRIGGRADIMVFPNDENQISRLVKYCKKVKIPYTIIGLGSNMLVSDKGIRGVVIALRDNFSQIKISNNLVTACSGASLRDTAKASFEKNLTGMEAVSGIPGTVGGAIIMNAGAYGTEMVDIVKKVRCMDKNGNILEFINEEMNFSYRHSVASEKEYIVLSATFELRNGDKKEILEAFEDFDHKRSSKQPLESYSAGSTFKRPEGYYASKLIDDSGLRGFTVKNAMVSEKHCGFLINKGEANCENFLELVEEVKRIVKNRYNVDLEREVKFIGEK